MSTNMTLKHVHRGIFLSILIAVFFQFNSSMLHVQVPNKVALFHHNSPCLFWTSYSVYRGKSVHYSRTMYVCNLIIIMCIFWLNNNRHQRILFWNIEFGKASFQIILRQVAKYWRKHCMLVINSVSFFSVHSSVAAKFLLVRYFIWKDFLYNVKDIRLIYILFLS